ncbi:MAG: glycerophosphodiester phosphodiesterase [Acidimicrobiales bacterium]
MSQPRYAFLDHPGPIPFAHRGGALEAPENTWRSFEHAHNLGYRFMETDVHTTSDGVVVAFHDADLTRMAARPELVRELSWQSVSSVRVDGDQAVPRLDELVGAWPEVRWNIDAKDDNVVGPLADTISRCAALERVCVTSFSDRRLGRVRRALGPALCTAMGPAAVATLRAASVMPAQIGGPVAALLRRFGAAQVPTHQGRLPLVDERFVAQAHTIGLEVHVWTIDEEEDMIRLLDLGVDGIMTDRPTVLKEVLASRGSWT